MESITFLENTFHFLARTLTILELIVMIIMTAIYSLIIFISPTFLTNPEDIFSFYKIYMNKELTLKLTSFT